MDYEQRISKTDLARSPHRVIREAQRGYTVLIENHGQPEVAIVDIVDFQLQRAAIHYFSFTKEYEADLEVTDALLGALETDQERFNMVVGHYLAEHQSIGRSAELLGMSTPELMIRLGRAGVPLRVGPQSKEELEEELRVIEASIRRK
jgi:predicted HTH domain antitoxin